MDSLQQLRRRLNPAPLAEWERELLYGTSSRRRRPSRVRSAVARPIKQRKYRDPKPPKSVKGQRKFWKRKIASAQSTILSLSHRSYLSNSAADAQKKEAANTIRTARAELRKLRTASPNIDPDRSES